MDFVEEALPGACFHGEVWMMCPYCKEGIETMGATPEYTKGKFRYYTCSKCKKLFKDRICY